MRAIIISLICICIYTNSTAQAFLGLYATDNYANQVRDNPAFAIHEDRMQLNFAGLGIDIGGNSILFKRSITKFLTSGNAQMDKDYFRNNNDQHQKMFWANIEVTGPGASLLLKKRYFIAINTGMRYLVNSDNLSDRVMGLLGVNPRIDGNKPDSFKISNYSLTGQVFSELNLTYAGFFYESEEYKLEGGATLKILNGISAAGLGIPDASFKTYAHDGYAYSTSGTVNLAFTPNANKWAVANNPFLALQVASNNMGLGMDLGMVYYTNPNEGFTVKKGYITRFAASVTDIGSINYTAASTSGSYRVNDTIINYRGIQNYNAITYGNRIFNNYIIDSVARQTASVKKFKVGLPTALHLNADFKVQPRIFVNANLLLNLRNPSADKYANHYVSTLTVAPRYMIKNFSFALPFSFNEIKQGYLGAIVCVGPFYIGSGSLFQLATSNSINNLNIYLGANMRLKPKKQKEKDMMMM
jgi:hypothetical protein